MANVVNRFILFLTRHWLAMANGVMLVVLALAFLAPALMALGTPGVGEFLYAAYRPLCHQLPERSFFVGGPQAAYSLQQLAAHLGFEVPLRWIGDPELGYKVAFCERDTAIYGGWLAAGLLFAPLRRRLKPLPWWVMLASLAPMAVDGVGQLFGVWESTWLLRVVTGTLFALGTTWFAYPYIERGMQDAQITALRCLEVADAADR